MKVLVLVMGVLLVLLTLLLARPPARGVQRGKDTGPAVASGADRPASDERLAALERRVDELALTLAALRDELERLEASRRVPLSAETPLTAPVTPGPAPAGEERGPSWYLEQYVASFANGGAGSEYFRLAVEAFVASLVRELGAIALDARSHPLLRQNLVAMLGDARLRGHGPAIDLLLRLVTLRGEMALVNTAIAALQQTGDERTGRALAGLLYGIETEESRAHAVQALVALAGPDANAVLLGLWARAPSDGARGLLIGQVLSNEGERSLELFELASMASPDVRLRAAEAVGAFRFPGFPPFVDAWSTRETDERVRAALGASKKSLTETPRWSAQRAAGPPDARSMDDDPNAWATLQPDMGDQWLQLAYDPPLPASGVRIFEVCVPGAVAAVSAIDERGSTHLLWSGVDPTASPGVFELAFASTPYRVRALRLTLDTNRRPGWSEIDAVELIGPEGRAWASAASASSSYGR